MDTSLIINGETLPEIKHTKINKTGMLIVIKHSLYGETTWPVWVKTSHSDLVCDASKVIDTDIRDETTMTGRKWQRALYPLTNVHFVQSCLP